MLKAAAPIAATTTRTRPQTVLPHPFPDVLELATLALVVAPL